MGRKAFWVGEHLANLLSKTVDELVGLYPQYDKNYLRVTKRYWSKQMEKQPGENSNVDQFRELLERSGIDPDDIERVKEVKVYQGFIKNNEGEIEYADLTSASLVPKAEPGVDYQAVPANIRPSKAKAPQRDHRVIGVFGDTQIDYRFIDGEYQPIHDERAMQVARFLFRHVRPDVIVNVGDSVDLPQFSKFEKDSTHFNNHTLQKAFQRIHDYYGELRADNPHAELHEVDSNHNTRLGKFVLRNIPDLWGFRPAGTPKEEWPMLTYPYMANLEKAGVTWHSGYDAAQYRYKDDLVFIHGKEVRSNGSTAEMLSKKYPYHNIIAGHGHRFEMHTRTTDQGKYHTAYQIGALTKITGEVPGYGSAVDDMGYPVPKYMNQQQGVLIIRDYGDGVYEFEPIYIRDGKAFYQGKEFKADA